MKLKVLLFAALLFCSFNIALWPLNAQSVDFAEQLQKCLSSGDINGAIKLYDSIPQSLSGDSDLLMLKASLLLSVKRFSEADSVAQELKNTNADEVEILELEAEIAKASGNKTKLKTVVNELIQKNPYNPTANVILGNQQALQKKYKLALNYYRKALTGDETNEDALFGFGQMSYYTGDLKQSRQTFTKLLEYNPYNAEAYAYLGKLDAESDNYLSATKNIQEAIKLSPETYDFYLDLGQYYRQRGMFKDAEEAWTKAISIDPSYFLAYTYRAGLYDEQERLQEALNDYKKIVSVNPKYYFAYEEIGILEFHLQHWSEARKYFLLADNTSPSTAYKLMILATYIKEKNMLEMKNLAQKYMRPLDRASLDYKIIRLYHDQGPMNAESAISRDLEKETDKNKRFKMMYYYALYFDMKGLPQVASEYYNRITKMQTPMFFEYRLAEWNSNGK